MYINIRILSLLFVWLWSI